MIEITTFGLMVLALITGALVRDLWRARRNRMRAVQLDSLVQEFFNQPVEMLIDLLGEPYEVAASLSGRSLHIWKSPPNKRLPDGSGLVTLTATVEVDGSISDLEWRSTA